MGPLRNAIAVAALSVFCDRSSYAFTAFARTKLSTRAPTTGLPLETTGAVAAPAASAYPGPTVMGESTQHLRQALPAFVEDYQLQEALARCEVILSASEAARIEKAPATTSAAAPGASENEDEVPTAGPVDGLRRFSRDGADGVFMGAAGVPVRYRLFPVYSPEEEGGKLRPGVVLLTGLMESMVKYGETIAHLNDRGFSVYTYDHHGQGLSGRLPFPEGADPTVAHITDFDHYVHDLVQFSKVVLPAMVPLRLHSDDKGATGRGGTGGGGGGAAVAGGEGESSLLRESGDGDGALRKLSVVAHSMGGLVAVKAALEEPLLFDGIVLAAPMLAPNTGKLPNGIVGAVAWAATKLAQGHRSPIRRPARATMEWSKVTHDRRRLQLWETLRGEVGCVLQRGPSFAWLSQAIRASKRGRRRLGDLSVSVLVLEAGLDRLVRSDGIERFRRRVPQAKYRVFDAAYHDLFDETDDIRLEVLRETCSFLENPSGQLADGDLSAG